MMTEIKIGKRTLGNGHPCFIIGELWPCMQRVLIV
jgi:hypothetical protein